MTSSNSKQARVEEVWSRSRLGAAINRRLECSSSCALRVTRRERVVPVLVDIPCARYQVSTSKQFLEPERIGMMPGYGLQHPAPLQRQFHLSPGVEIW